MAFLQTFLLISSVLYVALGQLRAPTQPIDDYYYDDAIVDTGPALPDHAVAAKKGEFVCPTGNGDFEDPVQCDKYWRCKNHVAHGLLCEDGLVFDESKAGVRASPCDSPYVVDCKTKKVLQDPTFPHKFCPRRYGYFADPEPAVCNVYYNCNDGKAIKTTCAPTLHFDETTGTCAWPDVANRLGCGDPKRETLNGFTCPKEEVLNDQGMKIPHPSYPNLDDCQKFFVCLNGITPQEAACTLGQVFDEKTMLCSFPEHVAECVGWYKNDPRFADYYYDTPADAADPGAQDTVVV